MYINTVLSVFVYTKIFIKSSFIIFKSNLALTVSNTCKDIIAKIVALISSSYCFC